MLHVTSLRRWSMAFSSIGRRLATSQGQLRQFSDGDSRVVKSEDTVRINLRMGLMDKRLISPKEGNMVEFTVGSNHLLIPKIEEEVLGMKIAQRKDFVCSTEEAFGDLNMALFPFIPASELPASFMEEVQLYDQLPASYKPVLDEHLSTKERKHPEAVISMTEQGITLDLNHPFSGHPILVSLYVLSIS